MEDALLQNKFEAMGARAKVRWFPEDARRGELWDVRSRRDAGTILRIDIAHDAKGEYFDLLAERRVRFDVVDHQPRDRHLLLLARDDGQKDKFLCGHDERHWFVAAVPDKPGVSGVRSAMEALKPELVVAAQQLKRLSYGQRFRRRNEAFVRQGEWFFVPAPEMEKTIDRRDVLSNEALSRGFGKAHLCQYLYRRGGRTVYVCPQRPGSVTTEQRAKLIQENPDARFWNWRVMQRDPEAYVRGWVRHSDHATIYLDVWHRVVMNTENQSRARANVVFLD